MGEGGMAVVWRAHDTVLDREVAIKVLRDQYARDPEFLARFRSEARAAAALNDPGVVSVYDVGEDGGRHFLVMEYVPGRDLKAVIRDEAPLSPQRAVEVATALAQAVAAAHRIGLVHRDIKPQNVLVSPDGRMKVADFGIARAVSAAGMTAPGLVMGTVHYIAPEQAAGKSATLASDVYSLGVVLYEMLTGSVPFDADSSVGVAMKIMNEDPTPVEQRNPQVPAVLAGIVGRAMDRRPEERYPDAGAMSDALRRFARWSEQVTGGLRVGEVAAERSPAPEARIRQEGAQPIGPRTTRHAAESAPVGPLLDATGLVLALIALLALAGLIPLWWAVLARVESSPLGRVSPNDWSAPQATSPAPEPDFAVAVDPELVPVPRVSGLEVGRATALLSEEGLSWTTPSEESDTVARENVIRQLPPAGQLVPPGTVVELFVSMGPRVEVPALGGDYNTVADALRELGFEPVRSDVWGGAGGELGMVVSLDPPAGSRWPPGSPVHVNVNSGSWLPLGVDFEDSIHLRGVNLAQDAVSPGGVLTFVAEWEAVAEVEGNYVARAVLESESGEVVARAELPPGDRPTPTWQPGERFSSGLFELHVDAGLAPGDYSLWLDLYATGDSGDRLPVRLRGYATVRRGRVLLMPITVG